MLNILTVLTCLCDNKGRKSSADSVTDISAVHFPGSQTQVKVNLEITRFDRRSGNWTTPSSAPQLLQRPAVLPTDILKVAAHAAHIQKQSGCLLSTQLHPGGA